MRLLVAIIVGLSIGITSIAMQSGMGGRLPNGDVFGPDGLYTENSDGSISPKTGGGGGYNGAGDIVQHRTVVTAASAPYVRGEVGYYPDGITTIIENICGYAGAPYGACTEEMIEKNKRGWRGFDEWTEKIRRENDDGTYYYVYRDWK